MSSPEQAVATLVIIGGGLVALACGGGLIWYVMVRHARAGPVFVVSAVALCELAIGGVALRWSS